MSIRLRHVAGSPGARRRIAVSTISFWGVAKLVKAPDFDSGTRRFESFLPSQS